MSTNARRVLQQDEAQFNASRRDENSNRNLQDEAQRYESEKYAIIKENKRLEKIEKTKLKAIADKKKADAKRTKAFSSLQDAGNFWNDAGGRNPEATQYNKDRNVIIASNQKILRDAGVSLSGGNLGSTQRTTSDILQGKSNVPLGQVSASIAQQVMFARLNDSVISGMFKGSFTEYKQSANAISSEYQTRTKQESVNRRIHSTAVAQGKAAQGVQQNFVAGSKFSVQSKTPVSSTKQPSTNTGSSTTQKPLKASQPNFSMVSPFISQYNNQPQNIARISQGLSYIGYSPSGKPIQGAVQPRYNVITPDGKQITFKDKKTADSFIKKTEGSYIQKGSTERKQDSNDFLNLLEADDKVKTFTARGSGGLEEFYKGIDKYGYNLDKQSKLLQKTKPNSAEDIIAGFNVSIYSQGAGLLNLLTQAGDLGDKYIFGKIVKEKKELFIPSTVAGEYIGGTVKDVLEGKPLKGTGVVYAQAQLDKQTSGATSGQLVGDIIPIIITGGATALKKVIGVGAEKIVLQTTAKTITGVPIKDVILVAKEYKIFGKTVATKTLKNPTVLKETKPFAIKERITSAIKRKSPDIKPKISPKSSKGTFSLGSTKASTVLKRASSNPQGKGFEVGTGSKAQMRFNIKMLKELEKKGISTKRDVEMIKVLQEGLDLVQKAPAKTFRAQVTLNALNTQQSTATFSAVRILQSPRNWLRGQRKIGKVGGSFSQESQLRPQYRKGNIHDLDIDVKSDKIAQRGAKTVYDKVKPLETKDIKFELSNRQVNAITKNNPSDEFAQFLSPKDVVKYQGGTVDTGLRFGYKFRDDKFSQYFKRPIKDPETRTKVRDIKDQAIAKAASIGSLQGKMTERFKGTPPPEYAKWITAQEKLVSEGKLTINPTISRGKDIVDEYKIFKSLAIDYKEVGKIKQGERLDFLGERIKSMNPDLPYSKGGSSGIGTNAPTSTSTFSSLSVAEAKKGLPLLSTVPRMSTVKQPNTTKTSLKVPNSKTSLKASKSLTSTSVNPLSVASVKPFNISSRTTSKGSPSSKGSQSKGISKSIFSKKPSPSSKSPSSKSPSSKSPSSKGGGGSKGGRGYGGTLNMNPSVKNPAKKKVALFWIDAINTTKKKKGKQKFPHDFLGNMRLDKFEGMFRRTEVIHGDKSTVKQIKRDKKKGFNQSKIKIFG